MAGLITICLPFNLYLYVRKITKHSKKLSCAFCISYKTVYKPYKGSIRYVFLKIALSLFSTKQHLSPCAKLQTTSAFVLMQDTIDLIYCSNKLSFLVKCNSANVLVFISQLKSNTIINHVNENNNHHMKFYTL